MELPLTEFLLQVPLWWVCNGWMFLVSKSSFPQWQTATNRPFRFCRKAHFLSSGNVRLYVCIMPVRVSKRDSLSPPSAFLSLFRRTQVSKSLALFLSFFLKPQKNNNYIVSGKTISTFYYLPCLAVFASFSCLQRMVSENSSLNFLTQYKSCTPLAFWSKYILMTRRVLIGTALRDLLK